MVFLHLTKQCTAGVNTHGSSLRVKCHCSGTLRHEAWGSPGWKPGTFIFPDGRSYLLSRCSPKTFGLAHACAQCIFMQTRSQPVVDTVWVPSQSWSFRGDDCLRMPHGTLRHVQKVNFNTQERPQHRTVMCRSPPATRGTLRY